MSGYPIPEDLKVRERSIRAYLRNPVISINRCNLREELDYIERIAKAEAKVARLSAPVNNEEWNREWNVPTRVEGEGAWVRYQIDAMLDKRNKEG